MGRVLVACEFSGRVREAFAARGYDAWSCDLEETEIEGKHLRCDVRAVLRWGWDLMVAFPPCTHLCVSGARWFAEKAEEQAEALEFVKTLMEAPIERIAIENPVGVISTKIRRPDQTIHPWCFGHAEFKATCLWLKDLPPLRATKIMQYDSCEDRVHREPPSPERWKNRSRTYEGIALAMAEQWG